LILELLKQATQIPRTHDLARGDLQALVLVWVAVLPVVLLRWRRPAQQL